MSGSVALVVIYNHRHSANVEKLENLYRARFSHIYHLMPFYEGARENVIPVYESSHYFQGHIAQGYNQYFAKSHRHYLFIADDLVLDPMINEGNYAEYFGLDGDGAKSFVFDLGPLDKAILWSHVRSVYTWGDKLQQRGLLPTYDEVLKRFEKFGLTIEPIPAYSIHVPPHCRIAPLRWRDITNIRATAWKLLAMYLKRRNRTYTPRLPFVAGYSDIYIVSSKHVRQFAHYCGIFAAGDLWVEIALPTSLLMCAEPGEIVTANDLSLRAMTMFDEKEAERFAERHGRQIGKLLTDWPEGTLFIHPVKMSQWSQWSQ